MSLLLSLRTNFRALRTCLHLVLSEPHDAELVRRLRQPDDWARSSGDNVPVIAANRLTRLRRARVTADRLQRRGLHRMR